MTTQAPPRPDYRSVARHPTYNIVMAYAAKEGECPGCGEAVEVHEPIILRGVARAVDDDGRKFLDLSDAEWGCQACPT